MAAPNDWQQLTRLTGSETFRVERVRLTESGIAIEGDFEPPPLAALSYDDQVFVAAFVRCHGSIKQMEKTFGVSYPTIKARLNRLSDQLGFIAVESTTTTAPPAAPSSDVLDALARGEITVDEAERRLKP